MDLRGPCGGIKNRDARRPASGEIKRGEASRTAFPSLPPSHRAIDGQSGRLEMGMRGPGSVFMVIREIEKYLEYSSEFDITTLPRYTVTYIYFTTRFFA